MAYFSNGTAGMVLDAQCEECLVPDDASCPILMAQNMMNYEQCKEGQEKLRECLNYLVDEKGICRMKPILDKMTPVYIERTRLENAGQINFLKG